jgi:predicted transcriptional regulator
MTPEPAVEELLLFFKSLADGNRLRIIGLLSVRPHTVEELAANLGLGISTVSHHLSRLSRAGLVEAKAEGYYSVYRLNAGHLTAMAKRLLKTEALPALAADVDLDSYDRKVLSAFLTREGRFKAFPMQEKKFLVLVRYALQAFRPGVRYAEKEVNRILKRYSDDTARLRRAFVDYGFMRRERGGGEYWRTGEDARS